MSRCTTIVFIAAATCAVLAAGFVRADEPVVTSKIMVDIEGLQPGAAVSVSLDTGEKLHGVVVAKDAETLTLLHPVLGKVGVPLARATAVTPATTEQTAALTAQMGELEDAAAAAVTEADVGEIEAEGPEEGGPPKLWKSGIEFGLDGSQGNTETLNVRLGARAARETERRKLSMAAVYTLKKDFDGDTSTIENRLVGDARHDWFILETPWEYFFSGHVEHDQKKSYDLLWAIGTGPAYRFIKNDRTSFIGRVGAGASQEVGGDDSDVRPELLGELDFEHKLTDRHTVGAFSGVYPDMSNLGEFRYIGRAYWDMAISETLPLKFRIGFEDRYQSDPDDGDKKNDLDYYASLIYDF